MLGLLRLASEIVRSRRGSRSQVRDYDVTCASTAVLAAKDSPGTIRYANSFSIHKPVSISHNIFLRQLLSNSSSVCTVISLITRRVISRCSDSAYIHMTRHDNETHSYPCNVFTNELQLKLLLDPHIICGDDSSHRDCLSLARNERRALLHLHTLHLSVRCDV